MPIRREILIWRYLMRPFLPENKLQKGAYKAINCTKPIPQLRPILQDVRLFISNVFMCSLLYVGAHLHRRARCWILHVFHQRTMFLSLKKPRQSKTKWGGTLKKNWTIFWCSISLPLGIANRPQNKYYQIRIFIFWRSYFGTHKHHTDWGTILHTHSGGEV